MSKYGCQKYNILKFYRINNWLCLNIFTVLAGPPSARSGSPSTRSGRYYSRGLPHRPQRPRYPSLPALPGLSLSDDLTRKSIKTTLATKSTTGRVYHT